MAGREPYSPKYRTALVLTGTGTAGAYHAGVLRALAEAGVRIDLVAGHGAGAIGAFFTAIEGGPSLWSQDGFWRQKAVSGFYAWRPALARGGMGVCRRAGPGARAARRAGVRPRRVPRLAPAQPPRPRCGAHARRELRVAGSRCLFTRRPGVVGPEGVVAAGGGGARGPGCRGLPRTNRGPETGARAVLVAGVRLAHRRRDPSSRTGRRRSGA